MLFKQNLRNFETPMGYSVAVIRQIPRKGDSTMDPKIIAVAVVAAVAVIGGVIVKKRKK